MTSTPHPWRRIGSEWPQVPVLRRAMASPFRHAETRWRSGCPVGVVLNRDLTQVQARCAIAHECEHLALGEPYTGAHAQIERRVVVATARYLLPDLDAVAGALILGDLPRAADELWVTVRVLRDRLDALSESERRRLGRHADCRGW